MEEKARDVLIATEHRIRESLSLVICNRCVNFERAGFFVTHKPSYCRSVGQPSVSIRPYSALTPLPRRLSSDSAWKGFATWAMVGGLRYRGCLIYRLTYLDCLLRLSQIIASVSALLFSPDARLENSVQYSRFYRRNR